MTASFDRPVPTIGDTSSAQQRAQDPRAWAMPETIREHLYTVIDARRDIRRFRPDPVDQATLDRILTAAHHGPSVGHSQPWRFIVIHNDDTRAQAAVMADRCRVQQAAVLEPVAARNLLDLQLEGIREAPIGIVVACDRRVPHQGVLGRATFADADMWSCASAIQNLWLAARAEGLGMGWVTLFKPEELATLLGLPEGVETLGWLCLGWPDERPPSPGLERRGWSKRLPLEDVVIYDHWPIDDIAPPAHRLDPGERAMALPDSERPLSAQAPRLGSTLAPPIAPIQAPGQARVVSARDSADNLLTPPGSLGLLDQVLDRANAIRPRATQHAHLVLVGADHPVTTHGISAFEPRVTGDVMRASVHGEGLGTALARAKGMAFSVIDAGVTTPIDGAIAMRPIHGRGDVLTTDAMDIRDVNDLITQGQAFGESLDADMVCLGEVGVGNTTIAAALAALLLDADPESCVGLGAGADTAMREAKLAIVRAVCARATHEGSPLDALALAGGPEFCVLVGIILGVVAQDRVVVLDGLATTIAAIIAQRLAPGVQSHLVAAHQSREIAHGLALAELGLEPIGDWRLRAGEGAGAVLVADLLNHIEQGRGLTARTVDPNS